MLGKFTVSLVGTKVGVPYHSCEYLALVGTFCGKKRKCGSVAAAKLLQSCPTLCDPIDGSPPGSAIPGILQAGALEWVAISFSKRMDTTLKFYFQIFRLPWYMHFHLAEI